MTLDRIVKFFSILDDSKLNKYSPLIKLRIRASNKDESLYRSTIKLDEFIGNVFSFLLLIGQMMFLIDVYMNEFEMKKMLIFALFKNFELNGIMMKKIKNLQGFYNETEVNKLPNFKNENDRETKKIEENLLEFNTKENENLESAPKETSMTSKMFLILESKKKSLFKVDVKKRIENRYDNDPFSFKRVWKEVDIEKEIEKLNQEAEK